MAISLRMMRLPDPSPSAAAEGLAGLRATTGLGSLSKAHLSGADAAMGLTRGDTIDVGMGPSEHCHLTSTPARGVRSPSSFRLSR
jgi:hypothetical protein